MHTARTRPLLRRAAALLLCGASACGDHSAGRTDASTGGDEGPPVSGGTAVIAELADINRPLPLIAETILDGDMGGDVMFNALTRGAWQGGRLVYLTAGQSPAALARSYEFMGPDSAQLRYHLVAGRKWSDGQPITSKDVVWTYRMLKDTTVGSPQQDYAARLDSVVAQDDSTVTFYFNRRYPDMVFHSGLGIAPEHVFRGVPPAQLRTAPVFSDPAAHLPVSGPYRIGEWVKGDHVTLVPNPYFPVKPRLDRIVFRIIPEATTRLTELMEGNVDFTRPVPYDQLQHVRQQAPNVRFAVEQGRYYDYIGYNPKTVPAFADPDVRRALGMAVDVKGLIGALQMQGHAVPAGGPYAPIFTDLYDPKTMPPLPYDTAGARRLLEQKGWVDRNGDGIREKDGKPLSFTLLINAGNVRRSDVAQIVQQAWKQLGVDARIQSVEFNTFSDRQRKHQFEATVAGWSIALSPDLTTIFGTGSPFNFVSYDDPQTQALFKQAAEAPTAAQSNALWREAAARIAQAQPYTFLYFMDQLDGVNRLQGMKVDTYGAYQNTWEWWIPKRLQNTGAGSAGARARPAPADTTHKA